MISELFITIELVFVVCLGASLLYYMLSDRKEWVGLLNLVLLLG